MSATRQFKGLWLPAEILQMDLTPVAKLLWADIHSFTGRDASYFKSNTRIAEDYGVSERTASRAVKELHEAGLVQRQTDGRTRWLRSRVDNLSMQTRQSGEADSTDCLHSKQVSKQQRTQQPNKSRPANREEVYIYFNELGSSMHEGDKFVDYYESNGWKQGRGSKDIKDWKAAARNWNRNAKQFGTKTRGFDAGNFTANGAVDFVVNG